MIQPPEGYTFNGSIAMNNSGDLLAGCNKESGASVFLRHNGSWQIYPEIVDDYPDQFPIALSDNGTAILLRQGYPEYDARALAFHLFSVDGENVFPIPTKGVDANDSACDIGPTGDIVWSDSQGSKDVRVKLRDAKGDHVIGVGFDPHINRRGDICFNTGVRVKTPKDRHGASYLKWEYHAKLWRDGKVTDIGTGLALDIADDGTVIGISYPDTHDRRTCWLVKNGRRREMGTLGFSYAQPIQINSKGEIIGYAKVVSKTDPRKTYVFGFFYSRGKAYDLNKLVTLPAGDSIASAEAINDSGRILCVISPPRKQIQRYAILEPIS